MISGVILKQFFAENNNTILNNTFNLKEFIGGTQNSTQSDSLPGIYLLFSQILQNLLADKTISQDSAVPFQEDKTMSVDNSLDHLERKNEEWIKYINVNLMGKNNRKEFNSITSFDIEGGNNRLLGNNIVIKTSHDEKDLVPKGQTQEKGFHDRGTAVKNEKERNLSILDILDTTRNKKDKDIEGNNKEWRISRNPHRIEFSDLFSGKHEKVPDEVVVNKNINNKPPISVNREVQSDIFQSKDKDMKEVKDNADNMIRQIVIDTENSDREKDAQESFIRKNDITKVHKARTKLENSHIFQNTSERVNFKVENNSIIQKQVGKDTGLNRLQEVEVVKDNTPKSQSLNLVLETEGLGKVALKVAVHNNLVRADFVANHINSIIHIQSNLSDLFASLYREGLMPEDFSFYLGDNGRENHKNQYKDNSETSMNEMGLKIKKGFRNHLYNVSIKA